jgi:hypothetical protein
VKKEESFRVLSNTSLFLVILDDSIVFLLPM